jgi:hypothetical protein
VLVADSAGETAEFRKQEGRKGRLIWSAIVLAEKSEWERVT